MIGVAHSRVTDLTAPTILEKKFINETEYNSEIDSATDSYVGGLRCNSQPGVSVS
jgi:hypothetical protein